MKRTWNIPRLIFTLYTLIIVWIVLFKLAFSFADIPWFALERSISLIPFRNLILSSRLHMQELILNAVIFIPFGLYLKLMGVSFIKTVFYGCLFSVTMELLQFAFCLGICDTTDVITNTLGTAVGACVYALAGKIFSSKAKLDNAIHVLAFLAILGFLVMALLLAIANG